VIKEKVKRDNIQFPMMLPFFPYHILFSGIILFFFYRNRSC